MNENKESLLQGLYYVKDMMTTMQNVLTEYINLERAFRSKQAAIGTTSVKDRSKLLAITAGGTLLAFYLLICAMSRDMTSIILLAASGAVIAFSKKKQKSKLKTLAYIIIAVSVCDVVYRLAMFLNFGIAIILIVILAAVIAAEYFFITGKNRRVAAHNKEVEIHNADVRAKRTALYDRYSSLQKELDSNAPGWFPPDYYNMEAVDFFINVVRNSRADSVKEMVNLFEATAQHQEMISYQRQQTAQLNQLINGQQAIQKELRFANMMNVANFIQLSGINSGVRNLNAQASGINRQLSGLNSTAGRIASDVDSIKSAVNNLRR